MTAEMEAFLAWLDAEHEKLAAISPGVCECGSLLAPDGTCWVRPSTHDALLDGPSL